MALVDGTNCGLVITAPSSDPDATSRTADAGTMAYKVTTPGNITKITEIGWYCNNDTEETNFEVGLFAHDGANDRPTGNAIAKYQTNAKGTVAGWKAVDVDISVSANTIYWIVVQVDNTATATGTDYTNYAGYRYLRSTYFSTTIPDPWDATGSLYYASMIAIYAVYEEEATTPGLKLNIGDTWVDFVSGGIYINIGDAWKSVTAVQVNIGDTWKLVWGVP